MKGDNRPPVIGKKEILFLFPLVYRPQKENFGRIFVLLSRWYTGQIFALSGSKQRYLPVGNFFFHSEKYDNKALGRLFRGLWIQIMVPLKLFWGKSQVAAVIAYDPFRSGLAALALKYLLQCRMVVELNGDYHRIKLGRNRWSQVLLRTMFNFVLRHADAIKVLNSDQEVFCRQLIQDKSIYHFPAFVATEYFRSLESFQGDYLLSIGQPFDLKGMDVLIAAFKLVANKHKRAHLRIMGYCQEREMEKYRMLAAGEHRIAFIRPGWIEDVAEQMRGCYALVNAARTEAMGRVHLEAMACGKPVVATRTNGARECIEEGKTGLLCSIGDVDDLAAKLDELLSNPSRADQMGKAGKKRVQQMFSEEQNIQGYHRMLEEIIGASTAD